MFRVNGDSVQNAFMKDCNFNLNEQAGKYIQACLPQAVIRRVTGPAYARFFFWPANWQNGNKKNFIIR